MKTPTMVTKYSLCLNKTKDKSKNKGLPATQRQNNPVCDLDHPEYQLLSVFETEVTLGKPLSTGQIAHMASYDI